MASLAAAPFACSSSGSSERVAMQRAILDRLNGDRGADRAVALVTALGGGGQALVYPNGDTAGDALPEAVVATAQEALRADQSRQVEAGDETWFVHVHNPAARMVIVGAVHITQALARMAEAAGLRCDRLRSPPRLRRCRALSRDRGLDRVARRRAEPARARPPHGGGDAHPRPEDRRPGAGGRSAGAGLLYRLAGQQADPRQAAGAPAREGFFPRTSLAASTPPSGSPSARARPPRSRFRSWPR